MCWVTFQDHHNIVTLGRRPSLFARLVCGLLSNKFSNRGNGRFRSVYTVLDASVALALTRHEHRMRVFRFRLRRTAIPVSVPCPIWKCTSCSRSSLWVVISWWNGFRWAISHCTVSDPSCELLSGRTLRYRLDKIRKGMLWLAMVYRYADLKSCSDHLYQWTTIQALA